MSLLMSHDSQPSDSDDDEVPANQPRSWGPAGRRPAVNPFLARQGSPFTCCPSDVESRLAFFQLIFSADVLGKILLKTNRYAAQNLRANLPPLSPVSKMRPWQGISDSDLKKFLGLVMLMGFI